MGLIPRHGHVPGLQLLGPGRGVCGRQSIDGSHVDVSLPLSLGVSGGIPSGEDYPTKEEEATWRRAGGGEEERAGPTSTWETREGSLGCGGEVPLEDEGPSPMPARVPVSGRKVP